jgi:hypothetical protein
VESQSRWCCHADVRDLFTTLRDVISRSINFSQMLTEVPPTRVLDMPTQFAPRESPVRATAL